MATTKKRYTAEQIVNKLRQADVELSKGATIALACKAIGVTGSNLLPLASRIRGTQGQPGQAAQGPRAREWPSEEAGGGSVA